MSTPARKHFQRVMAAQAAAAAGPAAAMVGDAHQLMLAALIEDRRRLKDIQSIERKIEVKRELLPNYAAYVSGVLESGQGAEDEVLMTVMIWSFDTGELAAGLQIAEYAMRHELNPPDRYERSTPAIVAEEVATEALRQLADENADVDALLAALERTETLTREADMHDQIRAKLHKASGYAFRAAGLGAAALDHLKRALELDERIGVKKDIERLDRELKKEAEQAKA
jgi:hypothetical protein